MSQHKSPAIQLEPVLDSGALPPEAISGRMHSGPGAESMMEAARAWEVLAAQLGEMAEKYRAVISELGVAEQNASVRAITQALAAHAAWLDATAAQARQTATQAGAAASAYGLTRAAAAAPGAIIANRLRRIWLAAANCLGQLSPAIADADADYDRMWAQDTAALVAYARASAAITLTPFSSPCARLSETTRHAAAVTEPSRRWRLTVAPEVISTGAQVISTISEALDALASSPLASFDVALLPKTAALSRLSSLSAPLDVALNHLSSLNKAAALDRASAVRSRWVTASGADDAATRVSVGNRAAVGALSVPRAWTRSMPSPPWPSPQASPVDRSQ
ncbi:MULTISPECIES: PPE family protein [unclassified Mycobacterium]|uniref:PPE family protein n=1 Tax=unclassified Mycobacterium TaxID=2642494 RepID=UPI000AFF1D0C|nr:MULTISPECIES: PPE family protein [unclassified Mycobacterium]